MTSFLLKKMWKNKWMVLCLLLGNILLVGIVSATPLYTQATMQRILLQDMRIFGQEENQHPAILTLRYDFSWTNPDHVWSGYLYTSTSILPSLTDEISVPASQTIESFTARNWAVWPAEVRERTPGRVRLSVFGATELWDNLELFYGRMPASYLVDGNIIEVLAPIQALFRFNLLLDELLLVDNLADYSPIRYMRLVGLYEPKEGTELYWTALRLNRMNTLLICESLLGSHFLQNYIEEYNIASYWNILLDYTEMRSRMLPHYLDTLEMFHYTYNEPNSPWHITENFSGNLQGHLAAVDGLPVILLVLQVPIYVLLALYIFMVSRQILTLEQNEISVLKSRGASRGQILGIYAMQSVIIIGISLPAGLWLGMTICHMLGASSGFLYMVQRAPLIVEMTPEAVLYSCAALSFSFLTMFMPVIKFSKVGIVEFKTGRLKRHKSLWQRFYLDILCFGTAVYGYTVFQRQQELMALVVRDTPAIDPLLFVISSLFIIGAGLLALRLFPYAIRLVYTLGRRSWSPASYAALLRVTRSAGEEQFIMIFLVITMAVGIFSAHSARTINTNNDHLIWYLSGADLIFMERWDNNIPPMPLDEESQALWWQTLPAHLVYQEPEFSRFTELEEVAALTRVHTVPGGIELTIGRTRLLDIQFMAIETHTFGETVWFRDDLLNIHINHFLNALAENPEGVLLSDNFRTRRGYSIGDRVIIDTARFYDRYEFRAEAEVIGFVEHWPTFVPMTMQSVRGEIISVDQYLVVANLGHIHSSWGVHPYEIWMRTNTDTNHFFYNLQEEMNLELEVFYDALGSITASRSDPILQGKNGVLTINFIVTLLICSAGFLIYWLLSIRSRVLQFGVFRAMGMSTGSIIRLLAVEQIFITFSALLIGAFVGEICARLFVPLVQVSYSAADRVIPLMVAAEARDYGNLFSVMGFMIILCMTILAVFISKIKVDQALKLGED